MIKDSFFELPDSSICEIPLYSLDGMLLNLGLLEVGCKPKGKSKQLRDKSRQLKYYWNNTYKRKVKQYDLQIYKMLAHYDPSQKDTLRLKKDGPDTVIFYSYISNEMLAELTEKDKTKLRQEVHNKPSQKELYEIIEAQESEELYKAITNETTIPKSGGLRGKLAEIFVQKDLEKVVPLGMNFFWNENIYRPNRKKGREVDGILTFYREDSYIELVENLRKLDHLFIKDKWH